MAESPDVAPPDTAPVKPSPLLDNVADWLMEQALGEASVEALFAGCCERLLAAGLPLLRGHISHRTLHPLFSSVGITWIRGRELQVERFTHTDQPPPERWLQSPLQYMIERRMPAMRRRLTGEEALLDFPVLKEFKTSGGTDYIAFLQRFDAASEDGIIGSWVTDRAAGFTDSETEALSKLRTCLAVACKMGIRGQVARNVVTTYLGPGAGLRVLDGQIRRGDGETLHAVIWYSDLRGSTRMSETLDPADYIRALNDYFEATAGAVLAAGGDVLSFIGDAVLAIFPIGEEEGGAAAACKKALEASSKAEIRLEKINRARGKRDAAPLDFGLGLHVGEVVFGNIGVPERLAFSVIGPVVNTVARIESLTKTLNRPILVSAKFADTLPIAWHSLGHHTVGGITEPLEIYAPVNGEFSA
ncbi:MAG: adenylate/guanylate cyclase domain-containing protein [Alphaproteobacteria bacterium]